jgi:hypothetical protein
VHQPLNAQWNKWKVEEEADPFLGLPVYRSTYRRGLYAEQCVFLYRGMPTAFSDKNIGNCK